MLNKQWFLYFKLSEIDDKERYTWSHVQEPHKPVLLLNIIIGLVGRRSSKSFVDSSNHFITACIFCLTLKDEQVFRRNKRERQKIYSGVKNMNNVEEVSIYS